VLRDPSPMQQASVCRTAADAVVKAGMLPASAAKAAMMGITVFLNCMAGSKTTRETRQWRRRCLGRLIDQAMGQSTKPLGVWLSEKIFALKLFD
jgi:hypothetical protein